MKTIFINILTFGTLISSVLAITSKNPVVSVIFVISTFVNAAGYLLLLGVNFVGISYIVIYVGAIAVLFLFVIMMINIKLTDILETGSQYTKNLPLALSIGFLFIYIVFTLIPLNLNTLTYGDSLSLFLDSITNLNGLISTSNLQYINLFNYLSLDLTISDTLITEFTQIEVLGHGLYTYGAILLIVLSIILLLAMVATIIISANPV
jgi:NADH-ubiquinone oxidoreductase chain 6